MAGIQNNQLWFSAIFHIFDVHIKFGILCQLKDNFAYFSIKHKLKVLIRSASKEHLQHIFMEN